MIDIGVQTKGIIPEMETEAGFDMIKRSGFTRVDFNLDNFLKNTDLYAGRLNGFFESSVEELVTFFLEYRMAMEKRGIRPSQMHAPYPVFISGRAEQNSYMLGNVLPKSIVIAEALNVPWVVLHPAKLQYYEGKQEEIDTNLQIFKSIVPILKQCHVGICIEDLYESIGSRITEGPCTDPEEAKWYVDTMNEYAGEELFGICLDTGHLQLTKRNAGDYIRTIGSRLKILHLHENDAIGDLHQMPYTFGSGRHDALDWEDIAKALKETGFDGTLSFETYPCVRSFPMGMETAVLDTIYAIGEHLKRMIEE